MKTKPLSTTQDRSFPRSPHELIPPRTKESIATKAFENEGGALSSGPAFRHPVQESQTNNHDGLTPDSRCCNGTSDASARKPGRAPGTLRDTLRRTSKGLRGAWQSFSAAFSRLETPSRERKSP